MRPIATVAAAAALLTLSACGYSTGQRAAIGAGAGAALGYGYSEFDRTVDPTATTLLGAAAGAAIGAVSGGPDDDRRYRRHRHRGWGGKWRYDDDD